MNKALKDIIACVPREKNIDWAAIEKTSLSPIFAKMMLTEQNPLHHGEGNVYLHTRAVCEELASMDAYLALNENEQNILFIAALLHDIGKIGIPDSIITKNSGLSDKEYFVTRKHPEIGAEILANISEIPDLGIGARWHHERYDGTGYPDGLKGNEIPEEARIIAVADAYDAMASRRSYRDVLPQQEVYEEIKKGKGTQFDPVFAEIMMALIEEDTAYNLREK
jgi:putative two-component system response regulator